MKSRRNPSDRSDAWEAANAYGCDVALLEESIQMTPQQRVQAHRSALALAEKLRAAMEKANARSGKALKTARRESR